jgi:hypothetical protein
MTLEGAPEVKERIGFSWVSRERKSHRHEFAQQTHIGDVAVLERPLRVPPCPKGGSMRSIAIMILAAAVFSPGAGGAQGFQQVAADPDMPTKEGFDIGRALFWSAPNFVPLRDPVWSSLRDARRARVVSDDTPVLVFEAGGSTLVLVTSQMTYHHVAQGDRNGEPWMVTF